MSAAEEIRAQAREVAAGWSPDGAPESWRLTAGLFEAIAAHQELLDRLACLPADRLPALLASAAISYLVRRDRPVPLAGYFPEPGGPQPRIDGGFPGAARAFISARLDDIVTECQGRRYQMNEVARCTQIALGIAAVMDPPARPASRATRPQVRPQPRLRTRPRRPSRSAWPTWAPGRPGAAPGPLPLSGR